MHMLRKARDLREYVLHTREGPVGKTEEFYFDEETWTVRYLAVGAADWLPGHRVLISPVMVGKISDDARTAAVDATLARIRNSPGISMGMPVTREFEAEYYRYYGWPAYWRGNDRWGCRPFPMDSVPPEMLEGKASPARSGGNDRCLRNTRQLEGCNVQSIDGEIGRVDDFIINDETWAIRYLVAHTGSWWPGREALVSPHWIVHIDWSAGMITLDVPKETIKQAPAYNSSSVISREYELRLFRHYDREQDMDAVRVARGFAEIK
ncbi:MAG: PRC-barrel domain-containing protein [Endomicrobiales bacterium]